MFVITLIANAERRNLEPALVESLRNAWGGGDAIWLAPDEAAEFSVSNLPENRWNVWQDCQNLGIDLIALPRENRRKKLLLADMDSRVKLGRLAQGPDEKRGFAGRVAGVFVTINGILTDMRPSLGKGVPLADLTDHRAFTSRFLSL